MKEKINLYQDSEVNRSSKISLVQINLFLEFNLSKNTFPNSILYYNENFHSLKPTSSNVSNVVVDELLHICQFLMPEFVPKQGDGEAVLYSHFSYNNYNFYHLDENNYRLLEVLLINNKNDFIEIKFYPFEEYKHMSAKVLRFMRDINNMENKVDLFLNKNL